MVSIEKYCRTRLRQARRSISEIRPRDRTASVTLSTRKPVCPSLESLLANNVTSQPRATSPSVMLLATVSQAPYCRGGVRQATGDRTATLLLGIVMLLNDLRNSWQPAPHRVGRSRNRWRDRPHHKE